MTQQLGVGFIGSGSAIISAAYASARTGEPEAVPFGGDRTKSPIELWRG